MRCDLNVPLAQGVIQDASRIKASLPSISYLQERRARLVILSHLGRPKGERIKELSLAPVARKLSELLGNPVKYAEDCVGPHAQAARQQLGEGEIVLLENLRFHPEETQNDSGFAQKLAQGADLFVNDAFGALHRAHASVDAVSQYVPKAAMGFLVEKEVHALKRLVLDPPRPYVALMGGAKVSDKLALLQSFLPRVDSMLLGGAMAFGFLRAQGHATGLFPLDDEQVNLASALLKEFPDKIKLPLDFVLSASFDAKKRQAASLKVAAFDAIPPNYYALDIGPKSIESFTKFFLSAKSIFWNGPMGVFEIEATAKGTLAMAHAIARAKSHAWSVAGGGDSIAAIGKAGCMLDFSHISTGGGAATAFLEGARLPGLDALSDALDAKEKKD